MGAGDEPNDWKEEHIVTHYVDNLQGMMETDRIYCTDENSIVLKEANYNKRFLDSNKRLSRRGNLSFHACYEPKIYSKNIF